MTRGRLITIEGIDGAGKTTLAAALLDALTTAASTVRCCASRAACAAAERIRELVKDPDLHVTARAEALLYAAARAQLVEEAIEPLLREGRWVLLDRFVDSSLAYQGAGRGLGIDAVRAINEFATGRRWPDRTLLLMIDPPLGREPLAVTRGGSRPPRARARRVLRRGSRPRISSWLPQEPERIRKIDASQAPDAVLAAALPSSRLLPRRPSLRNRSGGPARTPRRRRPSPPAPACAAPSRAPSGSARWPRPASAGRRDGGAPLRADVHAGDGPGRGDHLADREPVAVAEVEDPVLALARAVEREQMRGGQIVDVDVVANRRAVRGRIVGAVRSDAAGASPSATRRMFGIRCVSGSWSSPRSPLAPATLKYRRLTAPSPWAVQKSRIIRSTASFDAP